MTYSKSSNTENDLLKIQQHRERTYSKSDNRRESEREKKRGKYVDAIHIYSETL